MKHGCSGAGAIGSARLRDGCRRVLPTSPGGVAGVRAYKHGSPRSPRITVAAARLSAIADTWDGGASECGTAAWSQFHNDSALSGDDRDPLDIGASASQASLAQQESYATIRSSATNRTAIAQAASSAQLSFGRLSSRRIDARELEKATVHPEEVGESDQLVKLASLQEWVDSLDEEQAKWPSAAIYCEHKLREAYAKPVAQEPDRGRTVVVCELFSRLLPLLGRYGAVLGLLHKEMQKAIYVNDAEMKTMMGIPLDKKITATPFFLATQKVRRENENLQRKLERFSDVEAMLNEEVA